jgi:hypothetical protein
VGLWRVADRGGTLRFKNALLTYVHICDDVFVSE